MEQITVYAFPVFLLLMLVEIGYGLAIGRNTYRLSDALASLSQGLLSQLVASVSMLFQIGLYALAWRHLALFPMPPVGHALGLAAGHRDVRLL
jgi:hypothetical protein